MEGFGVFLAICSHVPLGNLHVSEEITALETQTVACKWKLSEIKGFRGCSSVWFHSSSYKLLYI